MSDFRLPVDVLTEIGSPIRESRLAAVDELSRLASGPDLPLAAAARDALHQLTEDDSRSVGAAAAAALRRTSLRLNPDRLDFGRVAAGTPRLVADVLVEGPPLAVAAATVSAAGPGLRAMLSGRRLRIVWLPRSAWLDGSVTVRGPAGEAEVRVTGEIAAALPSAAPSGRGGGYGSPPTYGAQPARLTVLPAPSERRRAGAGLLIAGLTALAVLGGAGVALALTSDRGRPGTTSAQLAPPSVEPLPSVRSVLPEARTRITPVPLAQRVVSLPKPVVVATVRVGAEPEGVAVSPDSGTVYVANQNSHILSVVDARKRRVTSIALRNTPRFVAVARDGSRVFVTMYEDDKRTGSGMAVIDAATRRVIRYVTTGLQPFTLAVGPDGRIWVPIHGSRRVEIYASGDQRRTGQVLVPPNPHAVAFATDLRRAYTANHESNAVSMIDMRADRLVKDAVVSRAPHSIAVSPDGRTVLAAGYEAGAADLLDARTLARRATVKVGLEPQSVAFAADSVHAYVVNEGSNTVSVLNGVNGTITATVPVGNSPRTVGVSPDGRFAYVSNGGDNTISILQVGE